MEKIKHCPRAAFIRKRQTRQKSAFLLYADFLKNGNPLRLENTTCACRRPDGTREKRKRAGSGRLARERVSPRREARKTYTDHGAVLPPARRLRFSPAGAGPHCNEIFSPQAMRNHIERLYVSLMYDFSHFGNEIPWSAAFPTISSKKEWKVAKGRKCRPVTPA